MRHRFDEIIKEEDSETIEHGTLNIYLLINLNHAAKLSLGYTIAS
jgi:hypothetical protein